MKKSKATCSPWLHARLGEQLGLSPRSSGRVGGLSAGAQRTRRSAKGERLAGRDNRKQNSDPSSHRESDAAQLVSLPCPEFSAISADSGHLWIRNGTTTEFRYFSSNG